MVNSMTAFAGGSGQGAGHGWSWDLRGLNGKGLELRLRVPDWVEGLEPALRTRLGGALARGSVTLAVRIVPLAPSGAAGLDPAGLDRALSLVAAVDKAAAGRGMALRPPAATEILALPGVLAAGAAAPDEAATGNGALREALLADLDGLMARFVAMRAAEGRALAAVIAGQIDRIEALTAAAAAAAAARAEPARAALSAALARVLETTEAVDAARLAQELALIAVKADVTEEIDRLGAHVVAARALLAEPGPVGRKFEFLTQEFNREANTLCSKSQDVALTRIGLDLKAVIDQMREQVQNVE